jgi:hypothetical protein
MGDYFFLADVANEVPLPRPSSPVNPKISPEKKKNLVHKR